MLKLQKENQLKLISNAIIEGLTESYYSLRLNSTDDVAGLQDDEIILDPV